MTMERIIPMYIEGTKFLGLSLDPLHSKEFDREALKEWVHAFKKSLPGLYATDPESGDQIGFDQLLDIDLFNFCLAVASYDDTLSKTAVDEIIWLLDMEEMADWDFAIDVVNAGRENGFMDFYPNTFKAMVQAFGNNPEEAIFITAEVSRFFRQVARYIYSLDNDTDLSDNKILSEYIDSFDKYIERVSVLGYREPENEYTREQVCKSWEKLVEDDSRTQSEGMIGRWVPAQGNAFFKGGLSELVLQRDGAGYMLRKKLFGKEQIAVSWEITEVMGMDAPVVHVPSMNTHIVFVVPDAERMIGNVVSQDSRLNGTMGVYQRA